MWTCRACQSAHTLFAPARANRGRGQVLPDVVLSPIIRTGLAFHFISSALLLLKSLAALKSCGGEAKIAFWPLLSPQPPSAAFPSSLSHLSWAREEGSTGKGALWAIGKSRRRAFSEPFSMPGEGMRSARWPLPRLRKREREGFGVGEGKNGAVLSQQPGFHFEPAASVLSSARHS